MQHIIAQGLVSVLSSVSSTLCLSEKVVQCWFLNELNPMIFFHQNKRQSNCMFTEAVTANSQAIISGTMQYFT